MKSAQPIPYQGSKRLQAPKIIEHLPPKFNRLVEPFAGSAALSYAVSCSKRTNSFLLNDLNRPLVNLLYKIIEHPDDISKKYDEIWTGQLGNERNYYNRIRSLFNEEQRSEYFLYLLARCVKGAVRYNSSGDFNQSPDNRRLGRKPRNMNNEIQRFSAALKGKCEFKSLDYKTLFEYMRDGDVLYMDPPYQGTSKNKDSRYLKGLNVSDFIDSLTQLNKNEIPYLFSYDGRLGNTVYGIDMPDDLHLKKIEIKTGRSTTSTLNGGKEETVESLYLSEALQRMQSRTSAVYSMPQLRINFV